MRVGASHDEERVERDPVRAPARPAPSGRPPTPAGLLYLPRGPGNAAVARLVAEGQGSSAAPDASAEADDPSKVEPTLGAPGPPLGPPKPHAPAGPLPKPKSPGKRPGPGKRGPLGGPVRRGGRGRPAVKAVSIPGGPRPRGRVEPGQDPAFKALKARVTMSKGRAGAHAPAATEAAAAQAAAVPPGNDVGAQAAAAQVEDMGAQKPGGFDRKAFVAAIHKALEAASPSSLEEADEFKESGKAGEVAGQVGGMVKAGKEASEGPIEETAKAPPDPSRATPKDVVPMAPEPAPPPLGKVGAAAAMPLPRPAEQTSLAAGPAAVESQMASANISEKTLLTANEPEFGGAVAAKKQAEAHSAAAPGEYRKQEAGALAAGRANAEAGAGKQLSGMTQGRVKAFTQVAAAKAATKSEDEAKRAKVAADIDAIYTRTKSDVTAILDGLEPKVTAAFEAGEKTARQAFEDEVAAKMSAYKDDRYSGLRGPYRWLRDKFAGMPSAVNAFYEQGRAGYLAAMESVIDQVATIVETDLNAATARIAAGRDEIRKYVSALPKDLRKVGAEAAQSVQEKFEELKGEVQAKGEALVDTVAQQYRSARDALDSRIDEMKAANRGLVDKALDAVVGVIKTILALKDMLLGVLAKAAAVIGEIISDPIGFLGNLIGGIKAGLDKFIGNIWTHVQNALMSWLFGALGGAGLKLPAKLDLRGILDIVLQILGLTYANIRSRAAKIVGPALVDRLESTVDVFKTLVTEGPAGLWKWVLEKLSNLEDMVLGKLKDFLVEKVIKAGITWLISLLNPAAAFIKACKLIYDVVMFFIERGSQIMEFVNSILDSVAAIAKGSLGVVADAIDRSLGNILPLAISFLASLIGLGGISEKVKSIIDTVRSPIDKAVDAIVGGAARAFKKTFGKGVAWAKGKVQAGKEWAAGKVEAGKEWVKGKAGAVKDRLTGGGKDDQAVDLRTRAAAMVGQRLRGEHSDEEVASVVGAVKAELAPQGLVRLDLVPAVEPGEQWLVAQASAAMKVGKTARKKPKDATAAVTLQARLVFDRPAVAALEAARGRPLDFVGVDVRKTRSTARRYPGEITGRQSAALGDVADRQLRYGSAAIEPTVPAGAPPAKEITVKAWNTGEPDPGSNSSHAETSFFPWLRTAMSGEGLVEVHVDISMSPCTMCASDFVDVTAKEGLKATICYVQAYERTERGAVAYPTTTRADVAALAAKGWRVTGPVPRFADAAALDAEKRATYSILDAQPF